MSSKNLKSKQIMFIICISIVTIFVLCLDFLLPLDIQNESSLLSTAKKQITMVPTSPESLASSSKTSFPISVKEFLELYNFNYLTDDPTHTEALGYLSMGQSMKSIHLYPMADGWEPTQILDYAQSLEDLPYAVIDKSRFYISSMCSDVIEVNEINASSNIKKYSLANDAVIWLLIGSSSYIRISKDDLDTYVKTDYGKSTLWAYAMRDGNILSLVEDYDR